MSSPPSSSGRDLLTPKALVIGVAALTLFRLIVAGLIPLTEDEAYYRLWSMRPQLGYFDHPPMVAWMIWLGRRLVGDNPLGVRLLPTLGAAVTSFLVFDMARLAGAAERTAVRAAIWFNATLLVGFGSILAIPDAGDSLFWALTLWCLLKAKRSGGARWWIAAGAAAGLATISKYSALFLAPGVLAWLLWSEDGRSQLRRPWPWVTVLVAGAVFALNVGWNAEHHWVSFTKQFGRVKPGPLTHKYLLEFAGALVLLPNPFITPFAAVAFRPRRRPLFPVDLSLFVATAAPFLIYLFLHSLHDRVQAHWPAPLFPGFALCAAVIADHAAPTLAAVWARKIAPWFGLVLTSLALIYLASGATLLGKKDPALPVRGWAPFARTVEMMRVQQQARWVGASSYGTAAELASRREIHAPVLQLNERDRYAFVASTGADLSAPGLVIDLERRVTETELRQCFDDVRPLGEVDRGFSRNHNTVYAAFRVSKPRRIVEGGCWKGDADGSSP